VIEIPDTLEVEESDHVPPDIVTTRRMGDGWLESKNTPVLKVPSVLVPRQYNYLLNPEHRLAKKIKLLTTSPFAFDPRLMSFPPFPPS
jgi:RES domain-containing protein